MKWHNPTEHVLSLAPFGLGKVAPGEDVTIPDELAWDVGSICPQLIAVDPFPPKPVQVSRNRFPKATYTDYVNSNDRALKDALDQPSEATISEPVFYPVK